MPNYYMCAVAVSNGKTTHHGAPGVPSRRASNSEHLYNGMRSSDPIKRPLIDVHAAAADPLARLILRLVHSQEVNAGRHAHVA